MSERFIELTDPTGRKFWVGVESIQVVRRPNWDDHRAAKAVVELYVGAREVCETVEEIMGLIARA